MLLTSWSALEDDFRTLLLRPETFEAQENAYKPEHGREYQISGLQV